VGKIARTAQGVSANPSGDFAHPAAIPWFRFSAHLFPVSGRLVFGADVRRSRFACQSGCYQTSLADAPVKMCQLYPRTGVNLAWLALQDWSKS
jgi:hypothetical protein